MQNKTRLDSLTSLRFFAAAMIVVHHSTSSGLFGFNDAQTQPSRLEQGVSFFFVLSGFILAFVYPKLESWPEIRSFWVARIARVWPALAFTFFLAFWLLSLDWNTPVAIANLAMVNAWIPLQNYYYSYNSPSWSISTEFFFYLAFPFLIYQRNKKRLAKLGMSFCLLLTIFFLSNLMQAKTLGDFDDYFAKTGLLYISPITRIFEFIFGMFVFSVWNKNRHATSWTQTRATFYEIGSAICVVASIYLAPLLGELMYSTFNEKAASYWLTFGGSTFAFGLLIYVMAKSKGLVSALLCHPILILLGEISFSLYLLHQIFLRYLHTNFIAFPAMTGVVLNAFFWLFLLLASYLTWIFVEMPFRQLIINQASKKTPTDRRAKQPWPKNLTLNRQAGATAVAFVIFCTLIFFSMDHSPQVYLQRKGIPISANSLSFYSAKGDLKMVRSLIDANADIQGLNDQGSTALIEASWAGHLPVVSALLKAEAEVNRISESKLTALSAAANQKNESVALLLLAHGANPDIFDTTGSSLLMHAAWQGNVRMLTALLDGGANPNYRSPQGITAMKAAVSNGKTAAAKVLSSRGAVD
jgi:peptidoglycan/LPS O-acetylase OafA/YrhL